MEKGEGRKKGEREEGKRRGKEREDLNKIN